MKAKKIIIIVIIIVILCITGYLYMKKREDKNPDSSTAIQKSILFLGDSQTASPSSSSDLYKKEFPTIANKKIAKIGEKTDWMLKNLKEYEGSYTDLVLFGGTNDEYSGYPLEKTKKNIQDIISLAKNKGANVVVFTIPPSKGYKTWTPAIAKKIQNLNAWIKTLQGVKILDVEKITGDGDALKKGYTVGDNLHLGNVGHKAVYSEFKKII